MQAIFRNMNRTSPTHAPAKLPVLAWIAGTLLFLFGLLAAFDYVMRLSSGEPYYRSSGMNDFQVAYYTSVPLWATGGWTLSVWGGLIGAALLLLRRAPARTFFLLSLLGNLIYDLYIYALSPGREAMGGLWWMPILMTVITAAMVWYTDRLRARRVLT